MGKQGIHLRREPYGYSYEGASGRRYAITHERTPWGDAQWVAAVSTAMGEDICCETLRGIKATIVAIENES